MPVESGGATEDVPPVPPPGDYANSCVGRERMFEYFSARHGTPGRLFRLNYAIDMRYGVLHDVGRKVRDGETIDLAMGHVNVIWQGDANASRCAASRTPRRRPRRSTSPARRRSRSAGWPREFGKLLGKAPKFTGKRGADRLAQQCGPHGQGVRRTRACRSRKMIEWTADWLARDMATLNKPTHYEVRDGKY